MLWLKGSNSTCIGWSWCIYLRSLAQTQLVGAFIYDAWFCFCHRFQNGVTGKPSDARVGFSKYVICNCVFQNCFEIGGGIIITENCSDVHNICRLQRALVGACGSKKKVGAYLNFVSLYKVKWNISKFKRQYFWYPIEWNWNISKLIVFFKVKYFLLPILIVNFGSSCYFSID